MVMLLFGQSHSQSGWFQQNSGIAQHLWGVHFVDSTTGTAVGNAGTILRTTDGGTTWTSQSSGTTNRLFAVYFTDPNNGTAVGELGVILRTTNGGESWVSQVSGRTRDLNDVFFTSVTTGYVVGNPDPIPGSDKGGSAMPVLRAFINETTTEAQTDGTILRTTDAGTTWTIQLSQIPIGLFGVSFPDINTGFTVGAGELILKTTDGGVDWTIQRLPPIAMNMLYGVSFANSDAGTAVGGTLILHTTDGGLTWTSQMSGTSHNLRAVSFSDANTGTAVGSGGTILRTTNGGATWNLQSSGTTQALYAVSFTDANNGTAVGLFGTILRTTTGGVVSAPDGNRAETLELFKLEQNYPNPFNGGTRIRYSIASKQSVSVRVYDVLGQQVGELVHEQQTAGEYETAWIASNFPSGIYFARLKTLNSVLTIKLLLLK